MMTGFRSVKVVLNATSGILDVHGNVLTVEVTNNGASTANFFPNDFPENGNPALVSIPIYAGQTRQIPMRVYNFKSDAPLDVVGYGM